MSEKHYINGILIKEVGQYGQLNLSIKVEDFIEALESVENNGWANLTIAKNKNPTDKGYTHHCYENTWKPDSSRQRTSKEDEAFDREMDKKGKEDPELPTDNDDLPF